METKIQQNIESNLLSKINEGHNTFDKLIEVMDVSESTITSILENLIANNTLVYNKNTKQYSYSTPLKDSMVILDGNIMLPTTIIRTKDSTLVCRGEWYKFPLDFDVRRIIWNIKIPSKQNSTLVDLIQNSILKQKKSKIKQLPEYQNLVNKLVPYSDSIKLNLNIIGEDVCSVNVLFIEKLYVDASNNDYVEFREFSIKSHINTQELINELSKTSTERNYQNINISRIFNISDLIFTGNCIPYRNDGTLEYFKINGVKNKMELIYYTFTNDGKHTKVGSDEFTIDEGIQKIKELLTFVENKLLALDILIEKTE